jgi:hypothetical protein
MRFDLPQRIACRSRLHARQFRSSCALLHFVVRITIKTFVRQHNLRLLNRQRQEFSYAAIVRGFAACEDKAERAAVMSACRSC